MRATLRIVFLGMLVPSIAVAVEDRPQVRGTPQVRGVPAFRQAPPARRPGFSLGGSLSSILGGLGGPGARADMEASRERGAQRFMAIANGTHDRASEVVVARGTLTAGGGAPWVAFLAGGDARSPRAQQRLRRALAGDGGARASREAISGLLEDHGHEGSSVAFEDRAHVLVVPGVRHYNVAATAGAPVTRNDVQLIQELYSIGRQLASSLGIASPQVWQNSPEAMSVAQTHIHLTGRYTPQAPVRDLDPPAGGRRGGPVLTVRGGRVVPLDGQTPSRR